MAMLSLPREKAPLLMEVVDRLQEIPGIAAIVLGGSYARGVAHAGSDLDLGLYYRPGHAFDIQEVRRVAEHFSSSSTPPVVTNFYGWGPWVNGGAWIHTKAGKVDFLYKNIDQVEQVIDDAQRGVVEHDYSQQPPYGFHSVVYLAETKCCVPLHDPEGVIEQLKRRVAQYPKALKERVVQTNLWGAEFSFYVATSANVYVAAGCLTRVAQYLTQALFALNEEYFMSDKDAVRQIERFERRPRDYANRLSAILARPGVTADELQQSLVAMKQIWQETVELAGDLYRSSYVL